MIECTLSGVDYGKKGPLRSIGESPKKSDAKQKGVNVERNRVESAILSFLGREANKVRGGGNLDWIAF